MDTQQHRSGLMVAVGQPRGLPLPGDPLPAEVFGNPHADCGIRR